MAHMNTHTPPTPPLPRTKCPECGKRLSTKHDGIFQWKECRACGWDVWKATA